ncbi:hypothetical protein HDU86_002817 [Geranomyces michiganensis]|nr:hypothetical protein HDU86_002817 [Geranomyces michiganensis]
MTAVLEQVARSNANVSTLLESNNFGASLVTISEQIAGLHNDLMTTPQAELEARGLEESFERPDTPHREFRGRISTPFSWRQSGFAQSRYEDDEVSSNGSHRGISVKLLPKFYGNNKPDEYERWVHTLRLTKETYEWSDHQVKKAMLLLFPAGLPAYNWFTMLDLEITRDLDFEGWMELIRLEYEDPEENIKAQVAFADCSPRSGKYKNFVEFIDDKIALRTRAFGSNANIEAPVQTTIKSIVGHLPPDVRALANLTNFTTFADLRRWTKQYFSSPRSQDQDPCVTRKRQHEKDSNSSNNLSGINNNGKGKSSKQSNSTNSTPKAVETNKKNSTGKPLPDGNKEPPGPCRFCQKMHWSIYCWKNNLLKGGEGIVRGSEQRYYGV